MSYPKSRSNEASEKHLHEVKSNKKIHSSNSQLIQAKKSHKMESNVSNSFVSKDDTHEANKKDLSFKLNESSKLSSNNRSEYLLNEK